MKEYSGGRIQITTGDITRITVDAIVNAANSSLLGGGGVDGAIHSAGGPEILAECRLIRQHTHPKGLPAGEAVITTAGRLPSNFVIHTVGPVWHGGSRGEETTLYNAYYNSLSLAEKKKLKTIAFPAISTGVYGFPKEKAATVAYSAAADFISTHQLPEKIIFVFFSIYDAELFESILKKNTEG